ncbi:MAG: hypothetical protein KME29_14140 [Calothrix sp. FI2-JRJ7]|nr:hypothetical protein [Calothrix sp. FI2-JRJ7]
MEHTWRHLLLKHEMDARLYSVSSLYKQAPQSRVICLLHFVYFFKRNQNLAALISVLAPVVYSSSSNVLNEVCLPMVEVFEYN